MYICMYVCMYVCVLAPNFAYTCTIHVLVETDVGVLYMYMYVQWCYAYVPRCIRDERPLSDDQRHGAPASVAGATESRRK